MSLSVARSKIALLKSGKVYFTI